jgi:hypothetical protein
MCSATSPMKWFVVLIACAIFVAVAAGCKSDVRFELPANESLKLLLYGGGKPLTEREILPSSKEHSLLAAWLVVNREGWSPTPATYIPGVYVRGKEFSINFLQTNVIINFRGGQYIKSVNPKDYEFLLESSRT